MDHNKIKKKAIKLIKKKYIDCIKVLVVDIIILILNFILSRFVVVLVGDTLKYIITYAFSLITIPISYGVTLFLFKLINNKKPKFKDIFYFYTHQVLDIYILSIIMSVLINIGIYFYILPLLVVYIYLMITQFLLVDKKYKVFNAIKLTFKLVNGYKWDYFNFLMSFLPWIAFSILSMGIGFIFTIPYISISNLLYYQQLIKNNT